ncbi:MAG TPA: non-homologous end-joining DNA ligase, partial [Acidobacteriaceae bacterium]
VMIRDKTSKEPEPYITLSTREALAGLAQMGVLEVHPWGSTNDDLEHPDRIIFDLDPDTAIDWPTVAAAAKEMRALLKKLGLESFLKSTGGKGLHVVAPVQPEHEWPAVKEFAHNVALHLERQHPERYLSKMSKAARANKIFLDYLRNERGATAVAPFSPRARAGVTVSVPLSWSELDAAERPSFSVADSAAWRSRLKRDPWQKLPALKQSLDLEKAAQILGNLK